MMHTSVHEVTVFPVDDSIKSLAISSYITIHVVVVVVVSHIQRIGCQPEKTTLHGGQSRSPYGVVRIVN